MTKEELIKRINDLEWEDFEVKEAKSELPKNIWETVGAFANTSGGWVVLGVKQTGKKFEITGVDNVEKLEQDFLGTLRSQKFNVRLSASSFRYDIDGHRILAFYVPSSSLKPIYYGNPSNTFIRMGSGDQRATEKEVMQMYHDQSFGIRSELSIPDTNLEMLNMDTLHSYRAYLNVDGALPQCKDLNDEEFCKKLNILDAKGLLTYAGLLMFGKSPYVTAYVPTFCMDYIEIPGPTVEAAYTRYTYRIPEQENLWESYLIIYRRLRTLIDTPFMLDSDRGVNVEDKRQWDVLREALANMCMHTDHFSPVRSCIHAFTDKIEFMNAGSLPMPAEQMVRTFYSSLRNPTIAKLFRFANISENVGFGMGKLLSWKQLTGNDVTCESDRNVVRVTFFLKNNIDKDLGVLSANTQEADIETQQMRLGERLGVKYSVIAFLNEILGEKLGVIEEECKKVQCKLGIKLGESWEKVGRKLGDNRVSIFFLLYFSPKITGQNVAKILDISTTSVDNHIKWFKDKKVLARIGNDRNGYWQINLESENEEENKDKSEV